MGTKYSTVYKIHDTLDRVYEDGQLISSIRREHLSRVRLKKKKKLNINWLSNNKVVYNTNQSY